MKSSFDYYRKVESPEMYLCSPNGKPLGTITAQNRQLNLRLDDLSELTFTAPWLQENDNTYKRIETRRLIFVDKIGWFQITNVVEKTTGDVITKEVTAESHQCIFKDKGFYLEERVYSFFNPSDKFDAHYNASDKGAIPSVIGQLCKQLGVRIADTLHLSPNTEVETDFGNWTIVYINASLWYRNGSENIVRGFKSGKKFGYDFMRNDVERAFEVIFDFDFLHHAIKIKTLEEVARETDIYLSMDNLMRTLSVKENAENIVTVLSCNGDDLDIYTVNPMGTNYIVNFDYYMKEVSDDGKIPYPWMSRELIEVLRNWKSEWERWQLDDASRTGHIKGYSRLVNELQQLYAEQAEIGRQLQFANLRHQDLLVAQSQEDKTEELSGGGFIQVEDVDCGSKSMLSASSFSVMAFDETSTVVAHQTQPTVQKIVDTQGQDNGAILAYHYEFSFADAGTNATAQSHVAGFVENSPDVSPLYFIDTNDKRSYCKLKITSDVGLVKDANDMVSLDGAAEVRGVIFRIKDETEHLKVICPDNSILNVLNGGYFTYGTGRYRIVRSSDGIISLYSFYVQGFDRFTSYTELVGGVDKPGQPDDAPDWIIRWQRKVSSIESAKAQKENEIKAKEQELQYISDQCEVDAYVKRQAIALHLNDLYSEFEQYWIEGDYTNNNLALLDGDDMSDRIDLAKQLMAAGQVELEKVSQPTFEMTVDSVNFLNLIEFRKFADQLELGRVITIEKDENTHYRPALVAISYSLDNADSFSLQFSTAAKLDETAMTFADLLNEASSTSRSVSANWSKLTDYTRNKETIESLIMAPLDRTLRAAQANMANQEFIIDETGVLGKKWSDDSRTAFSPKQVRIINNTILFTDDNWRTTRTALGEIVVDGEGGTSYGLIAETIIGSLLIGETLSIENNDKSVLIDGNGIIIKNNGVEVFKALSDGTVRVKGYSDDASLETRFSAVNGAIGDINGDISDINDSISGINGDISGIKTRVTAAESSITQNATEIALKVSATTYQTDMNAVNGAIGDINGDISDINDSISGINGELSLKLNTADLTSELVAKADNIFFTANKKLTISSTNFTLSEDGTITAANAVLSGQITSSSGTIGGFTIDANSLHSGVVSMSDTAHDGVYLGTDGISLGKGLFTVTSSGLMTIKTSGGFTTQITGRTMSLTNGVLYVGESTGRSSSVYNGYIAFTPNDWDNNNWDSNYAMYIGTKWYSDYELGFLRNQVQGGPSLQLAATRPASLGAVKSPSIFDGDAVIWLKYKGINSDKSRIDIEADTIALYGDTITIGHTNTTGSLLGTWTLNSSSIRTSDRNKKHSIEELPEEFSAMFDALVPVRYKYNYGTSDRYHTGFIAQDVLSAAVGAGISSQDCAMYCEWLEKDDDGNEVMSCGLRYDEIIPLAVKEIQKLKLRVAELERELKK